MAIAKKTARQAEKAQVKKDSPEGTGQLQAWSFSTSMRNPDRLSQILDIVIRDERQRAKKKESPRIWDADGQAWMFERLKEFDHYEEKKRSSDKVDDSGRGRMATTPTAQLGFINATPGQPLESTPLGRLYADALQESDQILIQDYLLLALTRLRLLIDREGKAGHYPAGKTGKGTPTAPLGYIIDLLMDESVFDAGGISLQRAKYLIPLAISDEVKPTLLELAHSKTFEKDIKAAVSGKLKTIKDYGDTLCRYLLLSGLFIRDSSTGKDKISIAPGREHQARRIRDALLSPNAHDHVTGWAEYRQEQAGAPQGALPWHGTTDDYISDCQEVAKLIYTLTDEAPEYDPDDRKAHITLRQALGEIQERKYINSGQNLRDFKLHLGQVRGAGDKRADGKRIKPLPFEAAVLRLGSALGNIGRFAPNYLKDNNNKPIAHAPGNEADGWIHGMGPNGPHLMLEASLQGGRGQAASEWQPAVRHLTNKKVNGEPIDLENAAGLLVMTSIHEDTIGMCAPNFHCLNLAPEFRPPPAYILPMTHTQYARLFENVVCDTHRLATLEEMVDWIKNTCKELSRNPNIRDPQVFAQGVDQAIESWNARMLDRRTQLGLGKARVRKAKP